LTNVIRRNREKQNNNKTFKKRNKKKMLNSEIQFMKKIKYKKKNCRGETVKYLFYIPSNTNPPEEGK